MAGVWSTPTLDLAIPSSGRLTPGSNTFYIGGPRLPASLATINVTTALVWYTNPSGFAAGYDYWFIGHVPTDGSSFYEAIVLGYKRTAQPTPSVLWTGNIDLFGNPTFAAFANNISLNASNVGSFVSLLGDFVNIVATDSMTVNAFNTFVLSASALGDAIELRAQGGQIDIGGDRSATQARLQLSGWQGNGPVAIKVVDPGTTNQDAWNTNTSTQTVGGKTSTVIFDWRWTSDYIVEVRLRVTTATPPFGVAFALNCNVPAGLPLPDSGPGTGVFVNAWGVLGAYNGANVIPLSARLNATGIVDVFSQALGTLQDFSGAFVYTAAKP